MIFGSAPQTLCTEGFEKRSSFKIGALFLFALLCLANTQSRADSYAGYDASSKVIQVKITAICRPNSFTDAQALTSSLKSHFFVLLVG